jgi:hypothetical protein
MHTRENLLGLLEHEPASAANMAVMLRETESLTRRNEIIGAGGGS